MKTSNQPFSIFIDNINKSVYAKERSEDRSSLRSGRVSFSHIKAIDKKIAECIKHEIYISAVDHQQLLQLRDVIEKQESRCTQEKLAKFDDTLKKLAEIKSQPCKTWELITLHQKVISNLRKVGIDPKQQERDYRFQDLCRRLTAIAKDNAPLPVQELIKNLIVTNDGPRMLAELKDFMKAHNITRPADYGVPDNSSEVETSTTLPVPASLKWDEMEDKINAIFTLDLELAGNKHLIGEIENEIQKLADDFHILPSPEGLAHLKSKTE